MINEGDKVRFNTAGLLDKFGSGLFTVEHLQDFGGGLFVKLEGLDGTFDALDCVTEHGEPLVPDKVSRYDRTAFAPERDEYLLSQIDDLRDLLPDPNLAQPETGFRETSFYRFPPVGECWCGKVLRHTLDGVRCEDSHHKGA